VALPWLVRREPATVISLSVVTTLEDMSLLAKGYQTEAPPPVTKEMIAHLREWANRG
jgi:hypothetical protein